MLHVRSTHSDTSFSLTAKSQWDRTKTLKFSTYGPVQNSSDDM